jgi:phage terminase large subunit-like protein
MDDVTARHIQNKSDELAVANGCYFDEAAADRPNQFFAAFVRVPMKGGVKPYTPTPWQAEVNRNLFGWRRADGKRRFREAYISMAKKNGKTYWAAGLLLYMEVCEVGPGQECYSFATEREQAALVYREAAKMVRASPELKAILTPIRTTKTIVFDDAGTFFRSMSAEADSADGINSAFTYYDELHRAKSRELYDTIKYAGTAIEERTGEPALLISTTTAGHDRESICYEVYSYAQRVRAGEIADDAFYTYIAEAEPGDDWTAESTWRKANPSLGSAIMPLAAFARDFAEARANPAAENRFRRLRLNQWTEQATRWIPLELWDANAGAFDAEAHAGRECCGGLDLASVNDTACFLLAFPNDLEGYDVLPRIFVPEDNLEDRGRRNGVSYTAWAKAGYLIPTPGPAIDPASIVKEIITLASKYKIKEIGFDNWNAPLIIQKLEEAGLVCVPIKQGYSLNAPAKELQRLLMLHRIRHANHPVMRWQAGNVEAKFDQHENIKLEKPGGSASKLKIDSIVSLVMALDRAMRHAPEEVQELGIAFV